MRYAPSIACLVFAVVATAGGALESYYWRRHFQRFDDPSMDFDLAWSRERFFAFVNTPTLIAPARLGLACAAVPLIGGILGLLILGFTRTQSGTLDPGRRVRWLAWSLLPVAGLSTMAALRVTTWHFPLPRDKPWDLLVDIARFDRNRGDYDRQKSCRTAVDYGFDVAAERSIQPALTAVGLDDAMRDLSDRCSDWTLDRLKKDTTHEELDRQQALRELMQYRRFLDTEHLAHFNAERARLFPPLPPPAPLKPLPPQIEGPLSRGEIDAGLERLVPKFRDCVSQHNAFSQSEVPEHRLNMHFTVRGDGEARYTI